MHAITPSHMLSSREHQSNNTVVSIQNTMIGNGVLAVMAGPCSVESEDQIHTIAALVAKAGANILRAGAFKPRTSPYDFQGLGNVGLKYLQTAAKAHQLITVSEVLDTQDVELVANHVDILQIGMRNMQNFPLLKAVGKTGKPILLKRGLSATYLEFLMAAEYILETGNPNVILCERGIRTFEPYSRNTLDIAAVPILKRLSHLPIIVDPSHGTGIREIVPAMSYAAVAAGADGIMLEVHDNPDESISDAKQSISPETLSIILETLRIMGPIVNMEVR
jgi:3-deoxy-7-phosphoheptulonate synthase